MIQHQTTSENWLFDRHCCVHIKQGLELSGDLKKHQTTHTHTHTEERFERIVWVCHVLVLVLATLHWFCLASDTVANLQQRLRAIVDWRDITASTRWDASECPWGRLTSVAQQQGARPRLLLAGKADGDLIAGAFHQQSLWQPWIVGQDGGLKATQVFQHHVLAFHQRHVEHLQTENMAHADLSNRGDRARLLLRTPAWRSS